MIPKIIHYCWFGKSKMSSLENNCINSWKKYLPDYELKLWNENNFDVARYPFAKAAYENKRYAFVSDVARLHALQEEGGIYLDTDMLLLKTLDPFLVHSFFVGYYVPGKLNAAIFGCNKGNLIVEFLLKKYSDLMFDNKRPYTIPELFDRELLNKKNNNEITFYTDDYFYPLPFEKKDEDYRKYITLNSYAVHLWNHSWKNEFSTLRDFYFITSIKIYLGNVFSFRREYWLMAYHRRYVRSFYRNIRKFLALKLKPRT